MFGLDVTMTVPFLHPDFSNGAERETIKKMLADLCIDAGSILCGFFIQQKCASKRVCFSMMLCPSHLVDPSLFELATGHARVRLTP